MLVTSLARGTGLLLLAVLSAGCGQVQNMAQGGSCGLDRPDQNVEKPVEGETASVDGYEGKDLGEAEALAKSRGHIVRVAGEDNDRRTLGDDYSWTRVNVYSKDGIVEAVEAF